jgi:Cof subfamily protein (haloacid dehalogenase superfamily)
MRWYYMDYKLIVTDMDGTLLSNHHEISEENKEALKKAIDKGIKVAIATGRIYTSARNYAKLLGINTPIIACNGAIIKEEHTGHVIYEDKIEYNTCTKIIDILDKYDLFYQFYTADSLFCKELTHSSLRYYKFNQSVSEDMKINIVIDNNIKEVIKDKDILKVIIIEDENVALLQEIKKELKHIDNIEICSSWHTNIEIMNKGVNKGHAVKRLAEFLGIKREEIITFGDNYNDLSMIEYAGMGVAMGNAEDLVKEKANYITDKNTESGVARALNKLLNI